MWGDRSLITHTPEKNIGTVYLQLKGYLATPTRRLSRTISPITIFYFKENMATGVRCWPLAFCITLLHIRSTFPKIVEGTLSTKEVV